MVSLPPTSWLQGWPSAVGFATATATARPEAVDATTVRRAATPVFLRCVTEPVPVTLRTRRRTVNSPVSRSGFVWSPAELLRSSLNCLLTPFQSNLHTFFSYPSPPPPPRQCPLGSIAPPHQPLLSYTYTHTQLLWNAIIVIVWRRRRQQQQQQELIVKRCSW